MKKKILGLILLTLLVPVFLFSATTGKVKGKVVDKETGEPMPGANVSVSGTSMGTASDLNGEFLILNVPAGVYTLRADFIGYKSVEISNIKIYSDLTTEIKFEMPVEALTGETVTIVAERPLVNKNATNAFRIQSYDEFRNVPIRNTQSIIALQPGVVIQDGIMYVRGGRRDEVGYYLEGAIARDVWNGNNAITIIPEALEEFQLQAGGYTAEYGGANAGIVRQTLRSGTPDYHLTLQAETDNFANSGEKFLDTYSYGYSDYTVTASGPLPFANKKLKFFLAGQNNFMRDRMARFWQGFDFNHTDEYVDNHNFPIVTTLYGDTISQGLHMLSGNIPFASQNSWIGAGTLVWDQNPFQVRFGTNLAWHSMESVDDMCNYENILNSHRIEKNDLSENLFNLKFTHVLNPKTFYEVNLNYFDYRNKLYDPFLKDNFPAYFDSIANTQFGYTFKDWQGGNVHDDVDIYGFDFDAPGTPGNYNKQHRTYYGGSFNFTTQFRSHELKLGGDFQRWTVRQYNLAGDTKNTGNGEASFFRNMISNPDQFRNAINGDPQAVGQFRTGAGIWNYGYDIFGNEINENQFGTDGPKHPQYMSFYVQDKYEVKQLVINFGVRLDIIDNDDFSFRDPANPAWDQINNALYADSLVKTDAYVLGSPRLGLAFPATDRTVFHVQYGKFVQAPNLLDIYAADRWYNDLFTGGNYFTTPVGFGLRPQKTTSYEVGFNHQFTENASFDITAFYKDIKDWITAGQVVGTANDLLSNYNVLVNGAFATTKGLEFSMTLRRTNRISAQASYTYSSALGTGSAPLVSIAAIEQGTAPPTIITPLDFQRPHVGSVNFDYRFGKNDGGPILSQSGLNLLLNFASGHPYTMRKGVFGQQDASVGGMISDTRDRVPLEAVNTSMTPWTWDLSLRLDKKVNLGRLSTTFYVYVQNLTNRRNVDNVFYRTGNPNDDGFQALSEISGPVAQANGGEKYWALYNALNLSGNGWNYSNAINAQANRVLNNLLFGKPRQIRLGVRFEL